jgi:hypothetical protein
MSDIGLAGVSTTSLNKVGPSGETLPGSAFGGLDAFGGRGPQIGINELGERVKDIDFKNMGAQMRRATSMLEGLIDNVFGGLRADLKYPLEADNPAYQARVQFRMFALQPKKPGQSQKHFDKVATDNLKTLLASSAKTEDVQAQVDSFAEYKAPFAGAQVDDFGDNRRGGYGAANAGIDGAATAAAATGPTATTSTNKGAKAMVGDTVKSIKDKITGNEVARRAGEFLMNGVDFQLLKNKPIVDMYFPLTMQFNDNAQYDNAPLGAFGAGVEAGLQQGAGALESVLGSFNQGITSMFDAIRGNQQLSETAMRVGLARVIDKASMLNTGVANALTLQNRTIINPNIRALFKGVGLREFTFQFKMIARSQLEAEVIRQIIEHFRTEMYPEALDIGGADIGFKFPNLFEIIFNYKGVPNKNMPKLMLCYLRNVSTTINPTGGAFRRDGQPNEVDLTLSFVEHRTLDKRDIKDGY